MVAQGVVTSLIEPYINDILENQEPLSLFSSGPVKLPIVLKTDFERRDNAL